MNAVLFTCFNHTPEQLALSKEALGSILGQDIPVSVYAVDNGSTPETREWMESVAEAMPNFSFIRNEENMAPVKVANERLATLFGRFDYKHILAVPNDVFLPENLYREFLRWPRGVVTGSMNGERNFPRFAEAHAVNTCTPMAVGLFRRWAYDALMEKDGYCLDPKFVHYASDCDFALRLAACGITGVQLDLQYFHQCSASWRLAPPDVAQAITSQADKDRGTFYEKWGFNVGDAEYGERASDINFKG